MKRDHTTIRNNNLFCLNCGGEYVLNYPISVNDMVKTTEVFQGVHKSCPKTWEEPKIDPGLSQSQRAQRWLAVGEKGMSSETIYHFFMGTRDVVGQPIKLHHPYDPDDFSRCYKLLRALPELKTRISEIGAISTPWKNLSENWEKLTEMYEENLRNEWKTSKQIGMYEFMQKLIK